MRTRSGDLQFELVTRWQRRPAGWPLEDIAAVCTDVDDNVYLYARGDHPVSTYSKDGSFLSAWSEGEFSPRSHGAFMARDGDLYLVDDGLGRVGRYSLDGKLLATVGPVGVASATGYQPGVEDSVKHAGPPYNRPTNLSVGPGGGLYVSDGYGNARVHRFHADGALMQSWGEPGSGPGEFRTPHGLTVHRDGRVFVADRQNDRIQVFSAGWRLPDGVDRRPTAAGHIHRRGRPRLCCRAELVPGRAVASAWRCYRAPPSSPQYLRHRGQPAASLG